jgi:glycosyltransferase involved in cell wall biosynthesis
VGHLLRDYETLLAAAWILNIKEVPVKIVIVDAQFDMPQFSGLDNVEVKQGIPDETLLALYQTADIFVLPLKDCTANNALLEALACGLPVITTKVGSVTDYVDSKCAVLTPFAEPAALAEAIIHLTGDGKLREQLGQQARVKAMNFAWESVAQQVIAAYRAVLKKKGLL